MRGKLISLAAEWLPASLECNSALDQKLSRWYIHPRVGRVLPGAKAPGPPAPDPQRLRKSNPKLGETCGWFDHGSELPPSNAATAAVGAKV